MPEILFFPISAPIGDQTDGWLKSGWILILANHLLSTALAQETLAIIHRRQIKELTQALTNIRKRLTLAN